MRAPVALPLVIVLALYATAQQPGDEPQSAASSQPQSASMQDLTYNGQDSARPPLELEKQSFWGKINPFARKKYVRQHLTPVRDRVNELDALSAANARAIQDVDARAQEGIRQASALAAEADRNAMEAGQRAQRAYSAAQQASSLVNLVEQVVGNIDQYYLASQIEIRFRPGQSRLSTKAKQALDVVAWNLQDQTGYIIQVQGFSSEPGRPGMQRSQAMANAVGRYLVEKNNVPVYRIFAVGLGDARLAAMTGSDAQPEHRDRVDISLLKNNVEQLAVLHQRRGATAAVANNAGINAAAVNGWEQPVALQKLSNHTNLKPAGPAGQPPPSRP